MAKRFLLTANRGANRTNHTTRGRQEIIVVDDCDAYLLRTSSWLLGGKTLSVYRVKKSPTGKHGGHGRVELLSHVILGVARDTYVERANGDWRDFRRENLIIKTRAQAMSDKAPQARAMRALYRIAGLAG